MLRRVPLVTLACWTLGVSACRYEPCPEGPLGKGTQVIALDGATDDLRERPSCEAFDSLTTGADLTVELEPVVLPPVCEEGIAAVPTVPGLSPTAGCVRVEPNGICGQFFATLTGGCTGVWHVEVVVVREDQLARPGGLRVTRSFEPDLAAVSTCRTAFAGIDLSEPCADRFWAHVADE